MGYTTPRTWVAGEYPTAAELNAHLRDNLNAAFPLGVDAWTAYTPTLVQSGAVTKTVTYAKYQRIGRLVIVNWQLAVTGSGTSGNDVVVGIPITAGTSGLDVGQGHLTDSSAGSAYQGTIYLASTTTISYRAGTAGTLGTSSPFTAALAAGDSLGGFAMYEAAS